MPSPWVTRALRGELPASDRTRVGWTASDYAAERRANLYEHPGNLTVDTGTGTHSVADLQRAVAREDAGR